MAICKLTSLRFFSHPFKLRPFHAALTLSAQSSRFPLPQLIRCLPLTAKTCHSRVSFTAERLYPHHNFACSTRSLSLSLPTYTHVREYGSMPKRRPARAEEVRKGHRITAGQMLVIGEDGSNFGLMKKRDALRLADEKDLELVQVLEERGGNTASFYAPFFSLSLSILIISFLSLPPLYISPPTHPFLPPSTPSQVQKKSPDQEAVCRLVSQKELWQENKNKSKRDPTLVVKEIKFTAFISEHDLATKIAQARLNLEKRHTVQVQIQHRRVKRVVDVKELQMKLLATVLERLRDVGTKSKPEVWTQRKDVVFVLKSTVEAPSE